MDRQSWLPANEWQLTYTIQIPIVRFAWSEFAVRFVPEKSGAVTLSLRGPWEEVAPGSGNIYKQEVLWDALQTTGTANLNGSFEMISGGVITGWSGGVSQTSSASAPAVEGQRMARTWHDGSMSRNLNVSAGVPVVLQFFARACVPPSFSDMKPISDRHTPAHQTALKFMRGVNFGNSLELPPDTASRLTYTSKDFAQARMEGFDHVRVPVAWQHYTGPAPSHTISASIFPQVDFMATNALAQGLGVIVDVHNFDEFFLDPPAFTNQLYAIWRQVAAHYADAPPTLVFEILNEPRDPTTTTMMNPIFAEAIRQIRATNPQRTLFIGTGAFNGISELNNLILPDNDSNLIATVHTYDPFLFTHQGLSWAGTDAAALPGVVFPGPPPKPLVPKATLNEWAANWLKDYNTLPTEKNPSSPAIFRERFQFIRRWSDYYGRPVHVGEFGAFETVDPQSRLNYYREKRRALDEFGLGWAIWDWKAGFHYWKDEAPDPPGLRHSLFPAPELRSRGKGSVELDGAIGKRFLIERLLPLKSPLAWEPISTQVLSAPKLEYTDANAAQNAAAFYRVQWVK